MKKWLEFLERNEKRKQALMFGAFIVLGITAALFSRAGQETNTAPDAPLELSTFIPRGHTLIPIDLKNGDQLDGVIGAHGVVDLFLASSERGEARQVGQRLRLVRAPLNPRAFAVLVRDSEAQKILSLAGPFIASVRPPEQAEHEMTQAKRSTRIQYSKGE